jgi:hypothetical protein
MMAANVDALCGPKGRHDPDRTPIRHGRDAGSVTLGGRRRPIRRPRVRAADGSEELPIASYEAFSSTERAAHPGTVLEVHEPDRVHDRDLQGARQEREELARRSDGPALGRGRDDRGGQAVPPGSTASCTSRPCAPLSGPTLARPSDPCLTMRTSPQPEFIRPPVSPGLPGCLSPLVDRCPAWST